MVKLNVKNNYQKDSFMHYKFTWNNNQYEIKGEPNKLLVQQVGGEIFCSLDVDSYYDCGVFRDGILFWGERLGKISGYNMASRKICFTTHINQDAETFYQEQASLYPFTFPPKTGGYDCLPEINLANAMVSKLAISAMSTYQSFLVVGDLSGRVSVFDVDALALLKTFCIEGAISQIQFDGSKIMVDYVPQSRVESPWSLCMYNEVVRVSLDFVM